jgi:hypothetical protein
MAALLAAPKAESKAERTVANWVAQLAG